MTSPSAPDTPFAALRASEERYRILFESNPHPMWVYDMETLAFLAVNDAAIRKYGYSREAFLAMTILDIRPKEDIPALLDNVSRVTEGLDSAGVWRHRTRDGAILLVEITSHTLEIGGRRCELVLAHDVTSRLEAEEALRRSESQLLQAQKMETVGRLAGGVAHDFNNLLTVIEGYCDLTLAGMGEDDPLRRNLLEIRKAGERASALTRQLLAFSRKQVLEPKILDLRALVGNMEKLLLRLIGEDIELVTLSAEDLGAVRADPGQIEQVIVNLAVNARDAMPGGGRLTIATANENPGAYCEQCHAPVEPGPYVLLSVTDTGCGMDESTRERIFEPFFTTKEPGKGTGLGLSTVYGIVRQSGGHIGVRSEPGKGSTFRIYLPSVAVPTGTHLAEAVPPGPDRGGTETILVAEDDPALRTLVREILSARGYNVLLAASGEDALGILTRRVAEVDLLLSDIIMPGMNGVELAARAKAMMPGLKTLYTSGYEADTIVKDGFLPPDTRYLRKPFPPEALARKVREVLDGPTAPGGS